MEQIIIRKTGSFWIDNGLVALADIVQTLDEEIEIELNEESLILRSPQPANSQNTQLLIDLLNQAKEKATQRYFVETQNAGWFYNDGQFQVYRKTDFSMALKPFFKGKTPNTEGTLCSPENKNTALELLENANISFTLKGKEGVIEVQEQQSLDGKNLILPLTKPTDKGSKGRFMTKDELSVFINFLAKNSPVKVGEKIIKLDGKGFLNSKPKYSIGLEFKKEHLQSGKKLCSFSGELVKSTSVVTGMDYPFLTGASGEINFISYLSTKPQISDKYAFIAIFSFYNLRYSLQNDFANYFILYDSDLGRLKKFYNRIRTPPEILNSPKAQYCNFENEIRGVQYEAESLMSFVISIFSQIRQNFRRDELLTKTIYTFGNDGNIFRDVKEYTKISLLFEFFNHLHSEERWTSFLNLLRYFSEKKGQDKYDTNWRNRLCDKILSFNSIATTIEHYLGNVRMRDGGHIAHLDSILLIYNQITQTDMKSEMVEMCKNLGNRIGRYCRDKKDSGILYSIRNSRNRIDFLKVLSESQFRTEISYSEEFFKELPEGPNWEEYKALVSIFAMNSYLFDPSKAKNQNQ